MLKSEQVAIAAALIALIIAVYALITQPQPYKPPPTASAVVKLVDSVHVDMPGAYTVKLGWINVKDAPALVELSANYTYVWFLLDDVRYGNPASAVLQPGNHTVSAIIVVQDNATKINISYRVVG